MKGWKRYDPGRRQKKFRSYIEGRLRDEGFEEAFREIERSSGSQFDPRIVDGFMSVPRRTWEKAKAETRGSLRPASIL